MSNKLINDKKNIVLSNISFTEKNNEQQKFEFFAYRSVPEPDPLFPEVGPRMKLIRNTAFTIFSGIHFYY